MSFRAPGCSLSRIPNVISYLDFLISPALATSFTPLPTPLPRQLGGQAYCDGQNPPHMRHC